MPFGWVVGGVARRVPSGWDRSSPQPAVRRCSAGSPMAPPWQGVSMARGVWCGRPGSDALARPRRADAAASPATGLYGDWAAAFGGGP
eukprot:scaffold14346_cov33-Tisochrysis_lutea.AAC.3